MNNLVLYIILCFGAVLNGYTQQNLVPNPSFEDTVNCPSGTAQFSSVANWFNPTNASPDYYNRCFGELPPGAFGAGIPANDWGYQEAQEGDGYAGFATYALYPNLIEYREYIAVKLSEELESANRYYWCFYVSLTDCVEYSSNNIGIALTNEIYQDLSTDSVLPLNVYGNYESRIDERKNWILVSGSFEASGGEQYLYIGNFFIDSETEAVKFQDNDRGGPSAAYFIDNVYLGESPCVEPNIEIPNIFTPNKDGVNDIYRTKDQGLINKEMIILNRWGNVVFEGEGSNGWDGKNRDGKRCSEGVYFVKITFTNALTDTKETKTGYVHLIR